MYFSQWSFKYIREIYQTPLPVQYLSQNSKLSFSSRLVKSATSFHLHSNYYMYFKHSCNNALKCIWQISYELFLHLIRQNKIVFFIQKVLLKVFSLFPLLSFCTFCINETPAGKQWKSWPFVKISYPASSFWNHAHAYMACI